MQEVSEEAVVYEGEALEKAYSHIINLITSNFGVSFYNRNRYIANGVLPNYPITTEEACGGHRHESIWMQITRYQSITKRLGKTYSLCSISIIYKGGLTHLEVETLPIQPVPGNIFYNSNILHYSVRGQEIESVETMYNELNIRGIAGVERILSGEMDEDIIYTLRQGFNKYLYQLENGL